MAPEQAAGDAANIGPRSDVFALGVILFEMLVGRPPFGGSAREVLSKVQREAVPPVRQLRPDVPKTLERLVAKATARNPKDRFPHMTAFADALTGFLRQPAKTGGGLGKAFLIVAVSAAVVFLLIALACGIGLLLPAMQKMRNAANQPQPAQLNDRALQKTIRALTDDAERLRESRDLEAALSQLDQAVRLAPGQPEPRRERAELLEEMGRLDDALADWTECVRLDPGEHGYRGKRADVLLELKRYREALADLDVAVRLLGEEESGDRTWLFVLRAEASHALGDHPAALADLKVVTDRDPVDNPFGEGANAYYLRARVKSALGDSAGAAADLTAAKRHADDLKPRYRAQLDR
jgi:tetratricopeptide (TPR) repeat protein